MIERCIMLTQRQPKQGELVAHCEHLDGTVYFFYFPSDQIKWIMCCKECCNDNGYPNLSKIDCVSTWQGDEPVIQVNPDRPEESAEMN